MNNNQKKLMTKKNIFKINIINVMKNVLSMNNRWACIAMNHKIKLKSNAQDTFGKRMKIDA